MRFILKITLLVLLPLAGSRGIRRPCGGAKGLWFTKCLSVWCVADPHPGRTNHEPHVLQLHPPEISWSAGDLAGLDGGGRGVQNQHHHQAAV